MVRMNKGKMKGERKVGKDLESEDGWMEGEQEK